MSASPLYHCVAQVAGLANLSRWIDPPARSVDRPVLQKCPVARSIRSICPKARISGGFSGIFNEDFRIFGLFARIFSDDSRIFGLFSGIFGEDSEIPILFVNIRGIARPTG